MKKAVQTTSFIIAKNLTRLHHPALFKIKKYKVNYQKYDGFTMDATDVEIGKVKDFYFHVVIWTNW